MLLVSSTSKKWAQHEQKEHYFILFYRDIYSHSVNIDRNNHLSSIFPFNYFYCPFISAMKEGNVHTPLVQIHISIWLKCVINKNLDQLPVLTEMKAKAETVLWFPWLIWMGTVQPIYLHIHKIAYQLNFSCFARFWNPNTALYHRARDHFVKKKS